MATIPFRMGAASIAVVLISLHPAALGREPTETPPLFRPAQSFPWGQFGPPHAMTVADVNGDGHPDVLAAMCDPNVDCSTVSVLLGNGDGGFRGPLTFTAGGNGASALAVADVTRDGKPDVLVANFVTDNVGLLRGNGDGTFEAAVSYRTVVPGSGAAGPVSIAVADLNGDHSPDLAVSHAQSKADNARAISVLFGRADGTFGPPSALPSGGVSARTVSVADVNRDQIPDLVVGNDWASFAERTHGTVAVLLGDGTGAFRRPVVYPTTGWGVPAVVVGDLDGDGATDVVAAIGSPKGVSVLLGRGNGTFAAARSVPVGGIDANMETRAGSLAIADVNGDSVPDLLTGTCFNEKCVGSLYVLPGKGHGVFGAPLEYATQGVGAGLVSVADLNGDLAPDAVVATCSDWQCSASQAEVMLHDTPSSAQISTDSTDTARPTSASTMGVVAAATTGAAVYNLKVVSDASPDLSDLDSLIKSTTSKWTSAADKVWALFYWSHILRRQTSPIVVHGFEVTDPIRNFLDYGFAMCSTASGMNQVLYEALGLRHEFWDICNHTVANVEYGGSFHMIDNSMSNLVTLDDEVTLASVVEAAADSARLVRLHSLYSTSPNGFLTGSDTMRNLVDTTSPVDGSTLKGFSNDFCASGLKKRDYYYNWNMGHRHVLNLRQDETYTRYYRRLGTTSDYWISSEQVANPDPSNTFQNDSSNRFGLHGNGTWSFAPPLTADAYQRAVYRSTNIVPAAAGGLQPATAGVPGDLVYKVQGADVIASQKIQAQFSRTDAAAAATIAVSVNHGLTWLDVATVGTAVGAALPVTASVRDAVNGTYETLIRIRMATTSQAPDGVRLTALTIDTITHVNVKALPALNIGRNEIHVGTGAQSDTMVLWPDLRGTFWNKDAYAAQNIASQSVAVPQKYTAVVYPATLSADAYLTYRFDAPSDVTRVSYGGRLYNYSAGSYIDFLHSFDGGANWTRSYRLDTVSKPYDVIHYETVAAPAGVRTVLFKYLIHNTATTAYRASGLYAVRMEVNHQPASGTSSPVDITWTWNEVQANRTTVPHSHTQRVDTFPFRYVIDVGGSDHPIMESIRLSVSRPGTSYGYSDGIDVGGQKYVPLKRTDGTNLAQSRPYAVSPAPTVFQGSAAAANTTILTDGVVGAPQTGSYAYWWGQCWAANQNVVLQIDLGQARTIGAVRAHLFGYPGWDALKGQVQDRVEIQTSVDGTTFTSRGLLPTSLWRKDIPVNYMLLDDGSATGWNFEQRYDAAITARYVRYILTPKRSYLCASELQVFDHVDYTPFDLRIALPSATIEPPPNQPPTVGLTSPAPNAVLAAGSDVTLAATAADADGTVGHVEFLVDGTVLTDDAAAPWSAAWTATAGTHTLTARAYDDAGAVTTSAPVSVTVSPPPPSTAGQDIVVWASEAAVVSGWTVTPDTTAAGGARLQNADLGAAKITAPLASPSRYFELTFYALAGRGYHLWIRGRALANAYQNDSAYVQFDQSVDQAGAPVYRIGTTSASVYSLEDCVGCGVAGWGWNDNGYASDGPLVYFLTTGRQRLRVQVREDGLGIDQVVLSSAQWLATAPGANKNDTTILPKTDSQQTDVVVWASDSRVVSGWTVTPDTTAAGGARLQNADLGAAKITTPLASPSRYFELTFDALAGRGYRLWIRGRAQANAYPNDSAYVQFDQSVDQAGAPLYRIGTTSATVYSLEDCVGCGVAGWGWNDNGYASDGPLVYFLTTGRQRLRVQVREDGLGIDQVVLSSARWLATAPGANKNDTNILPKTDSQ